MSTASPAQRKKHEGAERFAPGRARGVLIGVLAVLALTAAMSGTFSVHPDASHAALPASASAQGLEVDAGPDRNSSYGTRVYLNATISEWPFGMELMNFTWSLEDSGTKLLYGSNVSRIFSQTGVYNVTVVVRDPNGTTATDTVTIRVIPLVDLGPNRRVDEGTIRTIIVLNATLSVSNPPIVSYFWDFQYGGQRITNESPVFVFDFARRGEYNVSLTVTDANGMTASDYLIVRVVGKPSWFMANLAFTFVALPILIIAALLVINKLRKGSGLITDTDVEKARLHWKVFRKNWKVFRSNRLGMGGFIVLLMFVAVAIFAPWLVTVDDPSRVQEPNVLEDGWINPLPPSLSPSPYTGQLHPLGTDHKGGDVYSLTLYGSRASLIVGMVASAISVLLGTAIGLSAGYFGKVTDEVLMRVTDFFLVLPWFPLMIVMMAILGQKFIWVVVVIGITSWPSTARIVRSQVLTVKERQFIVRAKCVGATDGHIIKTHILPNVLPLIFANTVLLIALAIFSEAFLDFFGLGDPDVISWGLMLEQAYGAQAFLKGAWWWIAPPGAAIVLMVLSFSLVGYAIDDVLNPKLRRR